MKIAKHKKKKKKIKKCVIIAMRIIKRLYQH
jgi:hypothetical protein